MDGQATVISVEVTRCVPARPRHDNYHRSRENICSIAFHSISGIDARASTAHKILRINMTDMTRTSTASNPCVMTNLGDSIQGAARGALGRCEQHICRQQTDMAPLAEREAVCFRTEPASEVLNGKVCSNCERSLMPHASQSVLRDGTRLFCGRNCLWSCMLDVTGSRIRAAKRVKAEKSGRRPRRKQPRAAVMFEEHEVMMEKSEVGFVVMEENAMFSYLDRLFGLSASDQGDGAVS